MKIKQLLEWLTASVAFTSINISNTGSLPGRDRLPEKIYERSDLEREFQGVPLPTEVYDCFEQAVQAYLKEDKYNALDLYHRLRAVPWQGEIINATLLQKLALRFQRVIKGEETARYINLLEESYVVSYNVHAVCLALGDVEQAKKYKARHDKLKHQAQSR